MGRFIDVDVWSIGESSAKRPHWWGNTNILRENDLTVSAKPNDHIAQLASDGDVLTRWYTGYGQDDGDMFTIEMAEARPVVGISMYHRDFIGSLSCFLSFCISAYHSHSGRYHTGQERNFFPQSSDRFPVRCFGHTYHRNIDNHQSDPLCTE